MDDCWLRIEIEAGCHIEGSGQEEEKQCCGDMAVGPWCGDGDGGDGGCNGHCHHGVNARKLITGSGFIIFNSETLWDEREAGSVVGYRRERALGGPLST